MVIWQAWECQNGGVAGWGLMGSPRVHDPIHFNASLASLKREYDRGSFGMPREGGTSRQGGQLALWVCRGQKALL